MAQGTETVKGPWSRNVCVAAAAGAVAARIRIAATAKVRAKRVRWDFIVVLLFVGFPGRPAGWQWVPLESRFAISKRLASFA